MISWLLREQFLELDSHRAGYKEAADINRDGVIDLYDFVAIKRHILNIGIYPAVVTARREDIYE